MWSQYLILLVACLALVQGKRYCQQDDDCSDLGELFCIKSHCDWGVCACPRGKAAVFLGSTHQYGCVKVKKIGESCSTSGDEGVCGATNSYCDGDTCRCDITSTLVSRWGGEMCADEDDRYPGETCSPDGALGSCQGGSVCRSATTDTYWHNPVEYDMPTCACANNEVLYVSNLYANPATSSINPFVGNKQPYCIPRVVGDSCLRDGDCPTDAVCNGNNVCECDDSTKVPNYAGTECKLPLQFGDNCNDNEDIPAGDLITDYTCDGSLGLVCGDMCALTDADNYVGLPTSTCTCGPFHSMSGTTCSPIEEGGSCNGDYNCKGFSPNGICVDGTCQDSALRLAVSFSASLLMAMLALLVSNTY